MSIGFYVSMVALAIVMYVSFVSYKLYGNIQIGRALSKAAIPFERTDPSKKTMLVVVLQAAVLYLNDSLKCSMCQ
jgi:hypothetical protein